MLSEHREWFNNFLENLSKGFDGNVLDIGKSTEWDYSRLFKDYKTIDVLPKIQPDIVGDFCEYPFDEYFDLILCIGIFEQFRGSGTFEKMINKIKGLLAKDGIAIFGCPGKDFPCRNQVDSGKRTNLNELTKLLSGFKIVSFKTFDEIYYFLICKL